MFVLANPEGLLYRKLSPVYTTYGNLIGLNTTWRFFSPNPILDRIEYEAIGYDESGAVSYQVTRTFPDRNFDVHSRESFNRMMNLAAVYAAKEELSDNYLAPWLCRRHPKADEIYLYIIRTALPNIEKAKFLIGDRDSLAETNRFLLRSYKCAEVSHD